MADSWIRVEIKDEGLKDLLKSLKERVENPAEAMKEVGAIVRSSIIKNFQESGRPEKWKPKRKPRQGKVLIDTARLQNSINYKAYANRVEIGPDAVVYAAIHQFGGKAGRGHKVTIPARPYLAVQDEDWSEIKRVIENYLTRRNA